MFHAPVLLKEAVRFLNVKQGKKYIDSTIGGGGHAKAILKAGGEVLGIDCDVEAVKFARKRLVSACPPDVFRWKVALGNFVDLKKIARENGFGKLDGVIFDLGVSSYQLEMGRRGFSFAVEAPLDMRMDSRLRVSAADLINGLSKGELYELFIKYGEEKLARPIAAAVVRARALNPISSGHQLAEIVVRVYKKYYRTRSRIHPATKVFQALRIAVNDELNNLRKALPQAAGLLQPKGRLVVISFHGLEDGIVKRFFREKQKEGILTTMTQKPVVASAEEVKRNPRARSAKLRTAEKT